MRAARVDEAKGESLFMRTDQDARHAGAGSVGNTAEGMAELARYFGGGRE